METLKQRLLAYYEQNEAKVDIAFFLGGFLLDVFTLADIDDPLSILQQVVYLLIVGVILFYDFLAARGSTQIPHGLARFWNYRQLVVHFLMGSLLSIYSLFFLKSSSFFSSFIFVMILMGLMIANELKSIQKGQTHIKTGLYIICIFSFFSMLIPVLLGFVGIVPFFLALLCTACVLFGTYHLLLKKLGDHNALIRNLAAPGGTVMALFLVFYLVGWIPPVPLSVQNMGVYHAIEKRDGDYLLSHERPWWKFWQTGDQEFRAESGDKVYFFAQIFSPGRFDDSVILHWHFKDPKQGWKSTDKIPMRVTGGRTNGFRGFSIKQNYSPGDWRVGVETTDGREIGRLYFNITQVSQPNPHRAFQVEVR